MYATDGELTKRQLDILKLLSLGYAIKHISAELGLAVSTIKAILTSAYQRMKVNNGTHAVAEAIRRKYIQ